MSRSQPKISYPLISVIIPTYNVESYIDECLASVTASTYPNIEIIVVENNSSDGTLQRLQQLKGRYPFQLCHEHQAGAAAARNKGLSLASGEWLQFLDADDLLLPEKISHQFALTEDADLIIGSNLKQFADGSEQTIAIMSTAPWYALFANHLGNTCANLWRADSVRAVSGFDASLHSSQEYDLMFRLLKHGVRLAYDPKPLTIVRERLSGSISTTDAKGMWERNLGLRSDLLSYLRQYQPAVFEQHRAALHTVFIRRLHHLYPLNPPLARRYYREHIKAGFRIPRDGDIQPHHRALTNLLGFRATGELRRLLVWARARLPRL